MQNSLFTLFCGICLLMPFAASAEVSDADTTKVGVHPYKEVTPLSEEFAHWSISVGGAINMIDGDFIQPNITIIPKTRVRPSGTFELTYDFTPTWGISGLYSYAPYGIKQKETNDWLLQGQIHTLELLVHYDLIDAWFPQRKTNIFSLYFLGGLGLGFYNADYVIGESTKNPRTDGKYAMAGIVSAGLAAEFNISRSLALGAKGLYRMTTTDMLDTKPQGTNNDCMEYASLYLRWKIEASKKNHKRNYTNDDVLAALITPPAPPQKDTVCIITKDTIIIEQEPVVVKENKTDRFYVYFDNDKYNLKEEALQVIQQVADQLAEDSTLSLEIVGFCDHPASDEYNQTLSENRANRVAKEFEEIYNISANRLFATGQGRILNVKNSYGPNRRAVLRLCSKEELDELRQAQPQEETQVEEVPVVDVEKKRDILATVVSEELTTFARLANKYYDNPYCWPYIYAANKKVVMNNQPDLIMRDVEIVIPVLTQAEIEAANESTVKEMVATIQK